MENENAKFTYECQSCKSLISNESENNVKACSICGCNDLKLISYPKNKIPTKFINALGVFKEHKQIELAKKFYEKQPVYFDDSGSFWFWDDEVRAWYRIDRDEDIANAIYLSFGTDTIDSRERNEIFQALKQVGRLKKPKPVPKTWIQFKNGIIDIESPHVLLESTPEYFSVNPIPHSIGMNDETPVMDKIFAEWVGEKYVKTLHEIIAYCLIPDYPLHRLFCFVGEGMNGKSKFLELLRKFIGDSNSCSTELDNLLLSRFEQTRLYKKLLCVMGETNFNEMNKTAVLKKLTGGDFIGFEFKNKNPFESINYAKIIISTNNLPTTTDKTLGFYRRWLIIDFPNKFSEKKDILADIPEVEYENLAFKSIKILNELLQKREFHNEGSIEDRTKKFEEHSNPFEKFYAQNIEEDFNGYITKNQLLIRFTDWLQQNKYRKFSDHEISRLMKAKDVVDGIKFINWYEGDGRQTSRTARVWLGVKFKEK